MDYLSERFFGETTNCIKIPLDDNIMGLNYQPWHLLNLEYFGSFSIEKTLFVEVVL